MRVSLKWLKDYVDILTTPDDLARRLTMAGVEVGAIHRLGADWDRDKVFVGQVTALRPHPNADRLQIVEVDYGYGQTTVVAGAFNMREGDKVPLALAGATVINPYDEARPRMTIKRTVLRGVESNGMVCSERELGLGEDHEGILILPADAPVGTPLVDYLGDVVFELDIKGRWDCLGMINVAQEVAALQRVQLGTDARQGPPDVVTVRVPQVDYPTAGPHVDDLVTIEIEDPDLCTRYSGIVVQGIQVGSSPPWLQERLLAAGMRPINNIVDVTNYVLLEYDQPIHAFDYDLLRDRQGQTPAEGGVPVIIVRRARPGETIESLDEVHRDLTTDMLIIADGVGPVAIAGVMGGLDSEVTASTTNILIESANFNPVSVRRTARALRIPSEAQRRFEKGLPPEQTVPAAQRVAALVRELAGGTIAPGVGDCYPVQPKRDPVWITPAEARRLLGMTFSVPAMTRVFEALEFEVATDPEDDERLLVTPRYQRTDLILPADLVEEVARLTGYDKVPSTMLRGAPPPHEVVPGLYWEEVARDVFTAAGFDEVITYSLTNRRALLKLLPDEIAAQVVAGEQPPELPAGATADDRASTALAAVNRALVSLTVPPIKVANPLSAEMDSLRTTAMISLLETLAANLKNLDCDVCIFEVGRIYLPREDDLPLERRVLTAATGQWRVGQTWGAREELDFFDLKGAVETLLARMGITEVAWLPAVHPTFHPGRTAVIEVADPSIPGKRRRALQKADDGIPVGILGEVQHEARQHFGIDERCYLVSLDFDQLVTLATEVRAYQPVSRFPPVVQDIAIVVDEAVPAAWAEAVIRQAGKGMVVAVELFDQYQGPQIPPSKVSLAYHITYQAPDRTLTDEEVARVHTRIEKRLAEELRAAVRA